MKPFSQRIAEQLKAKPANRRLPKGTTYNVALVTAAWAAQGIPAPEAEFQFDPKRKWRFDFAWVLPHGARVAVEAQGGIWSRGRHTRGAALKKEWEKLNAAAAQGWRILYCEPAEIMSSKLADKIREALKIKYAASLAKQPATDEQTETPRTDAAVLTMDANEVHKTSRQLECELTAATKRAKDSELALYQCYAATGEDTGDLDDFRALVDRESVVIEAVKEATKRADEARNAEQALTYQLHLLQERYTAKESFAEEQGKNFGTAITERNALQLRVKELVELIREYVPDEYTFNTSPDLQQRMRAAIVAATGKENK
jgi:hypothetical protein